MSIKDNIKKELLKIIEDEENNIQATYSNCQYMYFTINDEFSKGKMVTFEEEMIFLDRLKKFVESI